MEHAKDIVGPILPAHWQRYNQTVPADRESADVPLGGEVTPQKALFKELFARVPEAIVLLDKDDRILRVNPEFTRIFGYAQEEALGRPINELVAPDELRAEAEEYTRHGARGDILNVETMRKRKGGTRVPVSIVAVPVSIARSQLSEYVIYRDITERTLAEQRLRQSEAYLAEAQRLSQTGSWAHTPRTGEITYGQSNATACWVLTPLGHHRTSKHFFSGFIRTIYP
jgi:PAS domain S-box-containing protein